MNEKFVDYYMQLIYNFDVKLQKYYKKKQQIKDFVLTKMEGNNEKRGVKRRSKEN